MYKRQAYEAEDSRRKERLELHNQAEVLAYKVDEALSKCKKELDKDEKLSLIHI